MITKFTIKNYKCIKDLTLNFSYDEKLTVEDYDENVDSIRCHHQGVYNSVPIIGLFGLNGGGKSTILDALRILKGILNDRTTNYYLYRINEKNVPTSFGIDFVIDNKNYSYNIDVYEDGSICKESLECCGHCLFQYGENIETKYADCISKNESFNKFLKKSLDEKTFKASFPFICNSSHFKEMNDDIDIAYDFIMSIKINESETYFDLDWVSSQLAKLDVGIKKVEYANQDFHFTHDDDKVVVDCFESKGILKAFTILGRVYNVLKNGGVLLYDNIDDSIHPILLKKILDLFLSKTHNPHKAQLIFTANNTGLMKLLTPFEIGIVSMTKKGGTNVKRICEFEGYRFIKDVEGEYLEGAFGGIPFPYL